MYSFPTFVNVLCIIIFSSIISYFTLKLLISNSVVFSKKKIERQKNLRWGDSNKSHLGGLAFSICAIITSFIIIFQNTFILGEITQEYKSFIGIFFIIIISSLVGVIDERENMMPLTKLFFQFIIASVLIWAGFVIPIFDIFFLNVFFSIFWIILIINSVNMFDNIDGATGTFCLTLFSFFLLYALYLNADLNIIFVLSAYIGSIIIFIIYNFYPSKLFMGDIGSFQLASVVSAVSIKLIWQENTSDMFFDKIYFFLLNNIIFLVIFLDVMFVSLLRISKNRSPFIGDTNHLSHALINIFKSPRIAVIILTIITLLLCMIYILFKSYINDFDFAIRFLALFLIYISVAIFLGSMYYLGIIKTRSKKTD